MSQRSPKDAVALYKAIHYVWSIVAIGPQMNCQWLVGWFDQEDRGTAKLPNLNSSKAR